MANAGCLFVVSAFESVDDATLTKLDKGHTAAEAAEAVAVVRRHGIDVRPSWLPFTPWTTREDLVAMLDFIAEHDLVASVDPVQYTIRLLLPRGSLLLEGADFEVGPFDDERLAYPWTSPLDGLQAELAGVVEAAADRGETIVETYHRVRRGRRRATPLSSPTVRNHPTSPRRGSAARSRRSCSSVRSGVRRRPAGVLPARPGRWCPGPGAGPCRCRGRPW